MRWPTEPEEGPGAIHAEDPKIVQELLKLSGRKSRGKQVLITDLGSYWSGRKPGACSRPDSPASTGTVSDSRPLSRTGCYSPCSGFSALSRAEGRAGGKAAAKPGLEDFSEQRKAAWQRFSGAIPVQEGDDLEDFDWHLEESRIRRQPERVALPYRWRDSTKALAERIWQSVGAEQRAASKQAEPKKQKQKPEAPPSSSSSFRRREMKNYEEVQKQVQELLERKNHEAMVQRAKRERDERQATRTRQTQLAFELLNGQEESGSLHVEEQSAKLLLKQKTGPLQMSSRGSISSSWAKVRGASSFKLQQEEEARKAADKQLDKEEDDVLQLQGLPSASHSVPLSPEQLEAAYWRKMWKLQMGMAAKVHKDTLSALDLDILLPAGQPPHDFIVAES